MIQATPVTDHARYILVQYMEDPRRRETKNIGVIVWSPGVAKCKFVDYASAGSFVGDMKTYSRWVGFWNDRTSETILQYHGRSARIDSDEYVDLLLSTQSGNYVLFPGGESLEPIPPSEVEDFADFMFQELVFQEPLDRPESPHDGDLRQKCAKLFQDIGVTRDYRLTRNREVNLSHQESWQRFKFDYSWGYERHDALLHRVSVGSQSSAAGAAFMFELVHGSKGVGIKGARTVSLVDTSRGIADDTHTAGRLTMLSRYSDVVDLAAPDAAAEKVAAVLGL